MIVIVPRLVLVKVHLTVSPASRWKPAVRVPTLPVLFASSQSMLDRSNGGGGSASVEVYVPGSRLSPTICPPSPIEPAASPVKVNEPAEPSGRVCFSTMILPSLVFVNVQVTVSLASTLMEALRVPVSTVLLASLQSRLVSFHPAVVPSVTL